jgi:hypothetical protein
MVTEQAAFEKAGIKRALTGDGVHMNIYGNLVMAKGVLATLGLDKDQLAAVEAKWNEAPDLFQTTPRIKLSLPQLAALEALAASQNKSLDTLINEISASALNTAIKATPTP